MTHTVSARDNNTPEKFVNSALFLSLLFPEKVGSNFISMYDAAG